MRPYVASHCDSHGRHKRMIEIHLSLYKYIAT